MSDLDLMVARATAAGARKVYKVGAVPSQPGDGYMVLSLDTGTFVNRRTGGGSDNKLRRLNAQCFGIHADAVQTMADLADAAFNDVTLTGLTGTPYCFRELNIGPTRDPDAGGLLYILHVYRF